MRRTSSESHAKSMSADRPKIRAVFDCMVFLQGAARRESAGGACLFLVELNAIELCLSDEIMAEVRDVLARPRVRQKFPALTDEIVEQFLAALVQRAVLVSDVPHISRFERDSKDEPYINLAIAARVSYLVSRDNDILDLADSSKPDGGRLWRLASFCRETGGNGRAQAGLADKLRLLCVIHKDERTRRVVNSLNRSY
jgi:putative PIN family toxin of toxin-antitoxin system